MVEINLSQPDLKSIFAKTFERKTGWITFMLSDMYAKVQAVNMSSLGISVLMVDLVGCP